VLVGRVLGDRPGVIVDPAGRRQAAAAAGPVPLDASAKEWPISRTRAAGGHRRCTDHHPRCRRLVRGHRQDPHPSRYSSQINGNQHKLRTDAESACQRGVH